MLLCNEFIVTEGQMYCILPWEALGRILPCLSFLLQMALEHPMACGSIRNVLHFSLVSSLLFLSQISVFLFTRTPVIILRAHPDNPEWAHVKIRNSICKILFLKWVTLAGSRDLREMYLWGLPFSSQQALSQGSDSRICALPARSYPVKCYRESPFSIPQGSKGLRLIHSVLFFHCIVHRKCSVKWNGFKHWISIEIMEAVFISLIAFLQAEYSPGTSVVPYVKFRSPTVLLPSCRYLLIWSVFFMTSRLNSW